MALSKTFRQRNKYLVLTLVFFSQALIFHSCKKTDSTLIYQQSLSKRNFFEIPKTVNSTIIRIVAELKKQNDSSKFINEFAKNEGFAIWDKSCIILSAPKNNSNNFFTPLASVSAVANKSVPDTIIYIPLVLENDDHVNAFIKARVSDTISMSLFRQSDYTRFPYQTMTAATVTTAENYALRMMQMDRDIFGRSEFDIKDKRLFSNGVLCKDTSRTKIIVKFGSAESNPANGYSINSVLHTVCVTITTTTNQCPYPSGQCPNINTGVLGPCDNCTQWCHGSSSTGEQCVSWWEDDPTGWPIIPIGGSGGGGGNGGPPSPCASNPTSLFPIPIINSAVLPPNCTPFPNPWPPPPPPPNPCDLFIGSLENDTTFRNYFNVLNQPNTISQSYEVGYMVTNRLANSYSLKTGEANKPEINWASELGANTLVSGCLHSHYCPTPPDDCLSFIFSAQDVILMAQIYLTGHARDTNNLFFGVTSAGPNPYLIKVNNTTAFRAFAKKIVGENGMDKSKMKKFLKNYSNKFNSQDASVTELEFLEMLQKEGGINGIGLYRSYSNCHNWQKLGLNSVGDVSVINCY
jgi:hypothetical protein